MIEEIKVTTNGVEYAITCEMHKNEKGYKLDLHTIDGRKPDEFEELWDIYWDTYTLLRKRDEHESSHCEESTRTGCSFRLRVTHGSTLLREESFNVPYNMDVGDIRRMHVKLLQLDLHDLRPLIWAGCLIIITGEFGQEFCIERDSDIDRALEWLSDAVLAVGV